MINVYFKTNNEYDIHLFQCMFDWDLRTVNINCVHGGKGVKVFDGKRMAGHAFLCPECYELAPKEERGE